MKEKYPELHSLTCDMMFSFTHLTLSTKRRGSRYTLVLLSGCSVLATPEATENVPAPVCYSVHAVHSYLAVKLCT